MTGLTEPLIGNFSKDVQTSKRGYNVLLRMENKNTVSNQLKDHSVTSILFKSYSRASEMLDDLSPGVRLGVLVS